MGIKHSSTASHGSKGLATEWNADHIIDNDVLMNQFSFLDLVIEGRTDFPAGPVLGQIVYRTDTKELFIWNGTVWDFATAFSGDMAGQKIINLGTPTADTDASTKLYVDTAVGSISSPITILGSGTFTSTGLESWEDVGNFSTTADIVNGVIFIDIRGCRDVGGSTLFEGLDIVAGNSVLFFEGAYINPMTSWRLMKNAVTPTTTDVHTLQNVTNSIRSGQAINLSIATTIYLKVKAGGLGTAGKFRWVAYLIK